MDAVASEPGTSAALADVALTPCELSAMREALRRPSEGVETERIAAALLTAVAVAPVTTPRSTTDWLRVLGQIRYDSPPARPIAAAIKTFQDRVMLAAAGSRSTTAPGADELSSWLESVR